MSFLTGNNIVPNIQSFSFFLQPTFLPTDDPTYEPTPMVSCYVNHSSLKNAMLTNANLTFWTYVIIKQPSPDPTPQPTILITAQPITPNVRHLHIIHIQCIDCNKNLIVVHFFSFSHSPHHSQHHGPRASH